MSDFAYCSNVRNLFYLQFSSFIVELIDELICILFVRNLFYMFYHACHGNKHYLIPSLCSVVTQGQNNFFRKRLLRKKPIEVYSDAL